MSLLYKNPEDIIISVEIEQKDGKVIIDFFADIGKHGVEESVNGFVLTPERLLEILNDRNDYKDEEL